MTKPAKTITADMALNSYYDKNIDTLHDKFREQKQHLAKLRKLERRERTADSARLLNSTTSSVRSLGAKSRVSSGRSSRSRVINGVDPKSIENKSRLAGFKFRSRVFRLTETVLDVYKKNLSL